MPLRSLFALLFALFCLAPAPLLAQEEDDDDPFAKLYGETNSQLSEEDLPQDLFERAEWLLERGRHAESEGLLRELLAAEKPTRAADLRYSLALLLLKTGRQEEAQEEISALEKLDPGDPRAPLLRGRLAEQRGELEAAAKAYRSAELTAAAAQAGGSVLFEAIVRRGALLAETGQKEEGGRTLERALEYYQRRSALAADEFAWVARACRLLDTFPEIKKQYSRTMIEYSRRMLDQALLADTRSLRAHVEAGTLALAKFDIPAAKKSFQAALEVDPNHPGARVGLARALLEDAYGGRAKYSEAARNLQAALDVDPSYPGAHATLAALAATDGQLEKASERLDLALSTHPAHVELLGVRAAVLILQGRSDELAQLEQRVLELRQNCARFYEEAARIVQLKFRYAEARDLAQKAIDLDPGYHPVLAILGVNLSRTGEEEKGRQILEQAFKADPFNIYVYNHLELFDRLEANYVTIETEHFTLRMHKDEEPSSRYVLGLLQEARRRLGEKYGSVPDKVLVEMFPDQDDFSARSIGLPGIPALGVCFGNVVTVLSANVGQKEDQAPEERRGVAHCWGRTLWHEFAHVATLTRTKNRLPRWLTEGLSVYEESRGRLTWAREYDREIMTLKARGMLLPIARLDEGFTKPSYGNQVIMSYYQGGATCEFIDDTWGFEKILALLDAFGAGQDTPAAIESTFGIDCEAFDARFHAYLAERYGRYAWRPRPSFEERKALQRRVADDPLDLPALGELALTLVQQGNLVDSRRYALTTLERAELAEQTWQAAPGSQRAEVAVVRLTGLRAAVADAQLALGLIAARKEQAGQALTHLRQALTLGTRDPVLAHQVRGQLLRQAGRLLEAVKEFETVRRLSPPNPQIHRLLHATYAKLGDQAKAMANLKAVAGLDSEDVQARLTYAKWAQEQGQWGEVAEILDDFNLIDPFRADVHFQLGEALRNSLPPETEAETRRQALLRAVDEYEVAEKMSYDYPAAAVYGRAACLELLGNKAAALKEAERALGLDPELAEARELRDRLQK